MIVTIIIFALIGFGLVQLDKTIGLKINDAIPNRKENVVANKNKGFIIGRPIEVIILFGTLIAVLLFIIFGKLNIFPKEQVLLTGLLSIVILVATMYFSAYTYGRVLNKDQSIEEAEEKAPEKETETVKEQTIEDQKKEAEIEDDEGADKKSWREKLKDNDILNS